MRRHVDQHGRAWDVIVGRESFGTLLALFVPAAGNRESARQAPLQADSQAEAENALGRFDSAQLDAMLEKSEPKGME